MRLIYGAGISFSATHAYKPTDGLGLSPGGGVQATLFSVGAACVIAAILGGGLKAFGLDFPPLASLHRQALLATFGCVLLIAAWLNSPRTQSQGTNTPSASTQGAGMQSATRTELQTSARSIFPGGSSQGDDWPTSTVRVGAIDIQFGIPPGWTRHDSNAPTSVLNLYAPSVEGVPSAFIVIQGGPENTGDLAASCQLHWQFFQQRWVVTDGGSYAPKTSAEGVNFCEFSGVVTGKQDQSQWRVILRVYNPKPGYFVSVKFQNHLPANNLSFSNADAFNHFFATLKSIP